MSGELNVIGLLSQADLVVKTVLGILLVTSIGTWAIAWRKFKLFKKIEEKDKEFEALYRSQSSYKEIYQGAKELSKMSLLAKIFEAGYLEIDKISKRSSESDVDLKTFFLARGSEVLARVFEKAIVDFRINAGDRLSFLGSTGTLAPFIGLFGTVWGIVNSFKAIAANGSAGLEAVAPGIAEALVATAIGLAVAIPAVMFFNMFSKKLKDRTGHAESFSREYLNNIERQILIPKRGGV